MTSPRKILFGCCCFLLAVSVVNVEAGFHNNRNSNIANLLVGGLLTLLFGELVGSPVGGGILSLSGRSNSESRSAIPAGLPVQATQAMPRFAAPLGNMPPLPLLAPPFGFPGGLPMASNPLGFPFIPGGIPQGRSFGNMEQINGLLNLGPMASLGNIDTINDIGNIGQLHSLWNFGQINPFGPIPVHSPVHGLGNVGQMPAMGNLKHMPVLGLQGQMPLGGFAPGIHFGHLLGMGAFHPILSRFGAQNLLQRNILGAPLTQGPQRQIAPRFAELKSPEQESENASFDMQDIPFPNSENENKNDRRPEDSSFNNQNIRFHNSDNGMQTDRRPQASTTDTVNAVNVKSEWEKALQT